MISNTFRDPLGTDLGAILGSKIEPKSVQIGLKSDHEANAKILKIIGRGGVFEDADG